MIIPLLFIHFIVHLTAVFASITEFSTSTAITTPALVLFYSTTCQYCEKFKPLWSYLHSVYPNISFVQVNAPKYKQYSSQFEVSSYPSIRLILSSNEMVPFTNQRTLQNLYDFIHTHTSTDPVQKLSPIADLSSTAMPSSIAEINTSDPLWANIFKQTPFIAVVAPSWMPQWQGPLSDYEYLAQELSTVNTVVGRIDSESDLVSFFQISQFPTVLRFSRPSSFSAMLKSKFTLLQRLQIERFDADYIRNSYPLVGSDFVREVVKGKFVTEKLSLDQFLNGTLPESPQNIEQEDEILEPELEKQYWELREL